MGSVLMGFFLLKCFWHLLIFFLLPPPSFSLSLSLSLSPPLLFYSLQHISVPASQRVPVGGL